MCVFRGREGGICLMKWVGLRYEIGMNLGWCVL